MRLSRDCAYLIVPSVLIAVGAYLVSSPPLQGIGRPDGEPSPSNLSSPLPGQVQESGLFFPEPEVDVGVFKQAIEHDFQVENRGESTIRLIGIKPSCNCTAAKPGKTVLQPGETTKISVSVDGSRQRVGRQLFVVDIEYQVGSSTYSKRLALHAQYRPDLVVPESVEVRSVPGKIVAGTFSLVDYREQPFQITSIATSPRGLEVKVLEKPYNFLPGWEHWLEVKFAASDLSFGKHPASIILHTTDPEHDPIVIPATINRVHRIRLAPENLRLKCDPNHETRQMGTVFLDDTEGEAIAIRSVSTAVKELKWRNVSASGDSGQTLEFSLGDGSAISKDQPIRVKILMEKPVREELWVSVIPLREASSSRR